jgi:hypothetical protein
LQTAGNEKSLGVIRDSLDSLWRSTVGSAISLKRAPISDNNIVEGLLAFNSENAAYFNERSGNYDCRLSEIFPVLSRKRLAALCPLRQRDFIDNRGTVRIFCHLPTRTANLIIRVERFENCAYRRVPWGHEEDCGWFPALRYRGLPQVLSRRD